MEVWGCGDVEVGGECGEGAASGSQATQSTPLTGEKGAITAYHDTLSSVVCILHRLRALLRFAALRSVRTSDDGVGRIRVSFPSILSVISTTSGAKAPLWDGGFSFGPQPAGPVSGGFGRFRAVSSVAEKRLSGRRRKKLGGNVRRCGDGHGHDTSPTNPSRNAFAGRIQFPRERKHKTRPISTIDPG